MTNKNTKAKNLIERIAGMSGARYSDKTIKNIEAILIAYKDINANKEYFNFSMFGNDSIEKLLPYVYKNFIRDDLVSDGVINRMVMQLLNDQKAQEILYETLDEVRDFKACDVLKNDGETKVPVGHIYHYILKNLYFVDEDSTNTDIFEDLDIGQNQYSYRKEEAIMLFGICFWHKCLMLTDNWQDMLRGILEKEGREDLIEISCL
ncbi:phosphoserine transaminase [Butyrivibrio sp. AC2005]|uniref:phosphoserine transaminase n=1 Tax=Butyrivibrio sp. AC2005 TaxID=1280672 RepID=UPI0004283870|nr:phosphoserine transaminase [Butyrivibrio sp. AC2005]